jgi:hypothetical protein
MKLTTHNAPSWRGAQSKHRDNFTFYILIAVIICIFVSDKSHDVFIVHKEFPCLLYLSRELKSGISYNLLQTLFVLHS